jgi:uncharacterized protein YegP (UPF0339 family)
MAARFEIVQAPDGKFLFQLRGTDGSVLLNGLSCDSKIMAQNEVLHVRNSLRDEARVIAHQADDSSSFLVIKDLKGTAIARSPQVSTGKELTAFTALIRTAAQNAPLVDLAKRKPLGSAQ